MSEIFVLPRKDPARRGLRLLLALLIVIGMTAYASIASQPAAHAAGCSPQLESNGYHIPNGCYSVPIPAAHHCIVIGSSNDGTTQAVECADLYATNANNEFDIWGEGTFYCQGSHPQCLGMNVEVWVSVTAILLPATTTNGTYKCNTSSPVCTNGGKAYVATTHYQAFGSGGLCTVAQSFEPKDGAVINTGPFHNYTNSEVISINGASSASHAKAENDSYSEGICANL